MRRSRLSLRLARVTGIALVALAPWAGRASWADVGPRQQHTIVFDPLRQRFLLFGGTQRPGFTSYNDVWEHGLAAGGEWTPVATAGTPPAPRSSHAAVYDPARDRMLVYGGYAAGILYGDVWQLSLSGTPTWTQLGTSGTPPAGRSNHTMVYDPTLDRLMVFGGLTPALSNETWYLYLGASGNTWQLQTVDSQNPGTRQDHLMIYDTSRNRTVIVGGERETTHPNDLWLLRNPYPLTYTLWSVNNANIRIGASAFYDVIGDRAVVFGGRNATTTLSDLNAIDFSESSFPWSALAPAAAPPARQYAAMAFDPASRTAILQGGQLGTDPSFDDTWRLTLSPTEAWAFLAGTPPATTSIPGGAQAGFFLAGFTPNPAGAFARVGFSLEAHVPATIEILDVSGRRVASQRIEDPEGGTATLGLAPAGGFAPGLYFIRLAQGAHTLVRRGSVMR